MITIDRYCPYCGEKTSHDVDRGCLRCLGEEENDNSEE